METYCGHCEGWYCTGTDQCNVLGEKFLPNLEEITGAKDQLQEEITWRKPSELNASHNCSHYRQIGFGKKLVRKISYGIPLSLSPLNSKSTP
ncbi:MAG: hypothetical protein KJ592_01445 [Nanoarchaeota archaeon]|nr:hypothetical protein [Nanoarchaeota archaeon]